MNAIVQSDKQLASALRGNISKALVDSGINHLQALTNIFSETKVKYEKCDNQKQNVNSPSVPKVRQTPRVAKAIIDELPELW